MNKKVICFGEILWDNLPTGRLAGGAPMNVAYHLRKLGIESSLISRIGKDVGGKALIDFIASINIPSQYIQVDATQKTSEVIGTLKANNEMVYDIIYPTAWDFIEWQGLYKNLIGTADAFIYGSLASRHYASRATLLRALETAKYKIFDVNLRAPHYNKQDIANLLQYANLVKINENEIDILGKWFTSYSQEKDLVNALREKFDIEEIIVTKGANGSSYYGKDDVEITQQSLSVEVVDTVGSGDSFLAGFLAKKLEGNTIENAFAFANQLGAYIATKAGACPSYEKSDLKQFKNQFLKTA